MPVTINDLYLSMRRQLLDIGSTAAALEAREILYAATGLTEKDRLADPLKYILDDEETTCRNLLKRRLDGEPLAYILGNWSFYGLELYVSPNVLIPRADTEVLVTAGLELAKRFTGDLRILDLCTGCGCIGLALAKHIPHAQVSLADISEDALRTARRNVNRLRLNNVTCVKADCLAPFNRILGTFDLIVSNPPYVTTEEWCELDSSVRDYEPRLALDGGIDGLSYYRAICEGWVDSLNSGGAIAFECGQGQAGQVGNIMLRSGVCELEVYKDTQGIERVVSGILTPLN